MTYSRMILASFAVLLASVEGDPPAPLCGQTPIDNPLEDRVIGGHQGAAGNWPWLVWMKVKRAGFYYQCTGTIISQKHVLTAASCMTTDDGKVIAPLDVNITGGVNQITNGQASGERANTTVKSITTDGEAAILELSETWPNFLNDAGIAPKHKYFQPVCLPANWKENIGEYGVVAGFGTNETSESVRVRSAQQGILRENIVPYRDLSVCISSGSVPDSGKYICAVGNQRDVAMGDEGGPLMTNIYGHWYQVGIVTRYRKDVDLSGRGLKMNGTLYDRIPQHCEWISKTVGGASACLKIEPDPACDPVFNPCSSTLSP